MIISIGIRFIFDFLQNIYYSETLNDYNKIRKN